MIGTHLFEELSHWWRIELKDTECLARRQEFVNSRVIEVEVFENKVDASVSLDVDECVVEDVEVS
ncbi:unannotated protein [freshwater metagenome]|uniref:Unannotated protein n=1 Tax=freshwater metagenome TaxID=449393 RepID=A0A6J6AZE9_9ZZZZ